MLAHEDGRRSTGRHAGEPDRQMSRRRWARGARFGLLFGLATTFAQAIDTAIFHRSYLDGRDFAGFLTGAGSLVLALICLAVIAGLAALAWNRAHGRTRLRCDSAETGLDSSLHVRRLAPGPG